ncbi:MAG: hypothetical protein ABIJ34_05625 [archaeon]
MDFAVIDDSQMRRGNIFVYSHAFIIFEGLPKILIFSGDKSIYKSESKKIGEFIETNLPEGCRLYACNHYKKYDRLWADLVYSSIECMRERAIVRTFQLADCYARQAAREELERLLESI